MGIARFEGLDMFVVEALGVGLLSYIDVPGYAKSSEDTFDEDDEGGVGRDWVVVDWVLVGLVEGGIVVDVDEAPFVSDVRFPWSSLLRCRIGWWLI